MLDHIRDGRTDLVFEYLKQGHSADSSDKQGVSLLQWCAYYGDVSAIRFLLEHGETLDTLGENLGLNGAVFHGHWQLCQYLLEQGANANHIQQDTHETPLHTALCRPNRPVFDLIVELLLANKAEPNCYTKKSAPTGSFMRDSRTKGETPLHRAAAFGSLVSIHNLLNAGATVDARDMNGDTPLSWASWHLRPDEVLRLLCYGEHSIHQSRNTTSDHGQGWGAMDLYLLGKPHLQPRDTR